MTDAERARYALYLGNPLALQDDLALARLMRDRAVTRGDSAVGESSVIARLASTFAEITRGKTYRVLPDEGALKRLADGLMKVVGRHVSREQMIEIAVDLQRQDWSAVAEGVGEVDTDETTETAQSSSAVVLGSPPTPSSIHD